VARIASSPVIVPVEAETGGSSLLKQAVEMLLEVGNPLVGVELHDYLKVVLLRFVHGGVIAAREGSHKPNCASRALP